MLTSTLLFVVGLIVLYVGAEWLIRGAAGVALRFGIRPMVIGLTVVAFGTSMPEFVVNFMAVSSGEQDIALGNIVGSNICNIGLILDASAMVFPLVVGRETLRKEYPIMLAVMVLFYVVSLDGVIGRVDGLLLVGALIGFLAYVVIDTRRYARTAEDPESADDSPESIERTSKRFGQVAIGVAMLALGANWMVNSAIFFAEALEIDPVVVGLTIVAVGTSLPEMAASVVGAIRREFDISVGNVLGSNLINVLFVIGLIAVVEPLSVGQSSLSLHFPVMLGFSVLIFPVMLTSRRITRAEGTLLVLGFTAYIVYLILPFI